jgi:hypothetical protein
VKWVEVVEAAAVVGLGVAVDVGQAGWVAPRPQDRGVIASALAAGTLSRTLWDSLVIRKSAPSAAHR